MNVENVCCIMLLCHQLRDIVYQACLFISQHGAEVQATADWPRLQHEPQLRAALAEFVARSQAENTPTDDAEHAPGKWRRSRSDPTLLRHSPYSGGPARHAAQATTSVVS